MLKMKKSAKGPIHNCAKYCWTTEANKMRDFADFLKAPGFDSIKWNDMKQWGSLSEFLMLEQI